MVENKENARRISKACSTRSKQIAAKPAVKAQEQIAPYKDVAPKAQPKPQPKTKSSFWSGILKIFDLKKQSQ